MPDKDSFTFSDKLRKSKSVPLSKRLPSIVGGQNKQKRTLVQRAQRDLPFILVAALALLLLPFLSRTGSDDIASTGDLAWNSLADAPSFAEGGGMNIMPEGSMKDPMDLILRPRSAVEGSGVTMGSEASKSAYGSEDDDGSGYSSSRRSRSYSASGSSSSRPDYNTRKSYDEQYTTRTTKTPATSKYGQKTRAGVRKSFERKGTDINRALRISQMPGQKGGSGVSHALPIGQGPTRGSGGAFREGVRPIALQPMESRGGVGRGMTGENLYAEAARSRGAMNAGGPAKANLLAAQMRDVDGTLTPMGTTSGGPGAGGASVRPGAGGGPGNTNGYSVQKPWWWDMMQTRSQKMWDLLYYKPREIWYTNMYNYASQLMNCLFTGNKDGDVSTMFGKSAGDDDWLCVKNGKEIMVTYNNQKTRSTKDKDGNKTDETVDTNWFLTCHELGGEAVKDEASAKGFFKVRAQCVGLDVLWDRLKSRIKHTQYDSHCLEVNGDPMKFTLDVTRSNEKGRHNERREETLQEKTVITLLAKVKEGPYKGKELVVYAQQGNSLKQPEGSDFAKKFNDEYKNCALSKLVAFTSRKGSLRVEQKVSRYNAKEDKADYAGITPLFDKETGKRVGTEVIGVTDDGLMFPSLSIIPEEGQITAAKKICGNGDAETAAKPLTLDDIRSGAELGKGKKASYAECEIWEKKPTKGAMAISGLPCGPYPEKEVGIKATEEFSATIANSADKQVYAVLVDQIDQETNAKVVFVADFNSDSYRDLKTCPNKGSTCTYRFTVNAASLGWATNEYRQKIVPMFKDVVNSTDTTVKPGGTARGSGKVFWIITKGATSLKVKEGDDLKHGLGLVNIEDFLDYNQSAYHTTCSYRWCDDIGVCGIPDGTKVSENMCREGNLAYPAIPIPLEKEKDGKKETVTLYVKVEGSEGIDYMLDDLPYCEKMCKSDNGDLYKQAPDGTPEDEPECPYAKLSEEARLALGMLKPCPVCCRHTDGNTYRSLEVNGKYFIIDARTDQCKGITAKHTCDVAAWSEHEGQFQVYNMIGNYNPDHLPLTPDSADFNVAQYTGDPDIPLGADLIDLIEEFRIIKGQAETWEPRKPGEFQLFPKLVLLDEEEVVAACKIKLKFKYQNASYVPQRPEYTDAANAIADCINKIKTLTATDPDLADKYSTLYFHGFASYGGNEYKNCDGKEQTGPQCNMALSEDRNLYVMDQIAEILGRGFSIGKVSATTSELGNPKDLNGFTNTNENNPKKRIGAPYRYRKNYTDTSGKDITFKSVPHGEDGATWTSEASMSDDEIERIHSRDRFIVIDIISDLTRQDVIDDPSYEEYSDTGYNINSPSKTPGNK